MRHGLRRVPAPGECSDACGGDGVTEPESVRADPRGAPAASRLRLSSRDLFRGQREIVILHAGHEYLLRITRGDKLILTK